MAELPPRRFPPPWRMVEKAGEHDTDRLAVLVLNDLVDDAA
jgi:hypothetical protein